MDSLQSRQQPDGVSGYTFKRRFVHIDHKQVISLQCGHGDADDGSGSPYVKTLFHKNHKQMISLQSGRADGKSGVLFV